MLTGDLSNAVSLAISLNVLLQHHNTSNDHKYSILDTGIYVPTVVSRCNTKTITDTFLICLALGVLLIAYAY